MPKFVKILGVKIPLDTLAHVTSTPPVAYNSYILGTTGLLVDNSLIQSLKADLDSDKASWLRPAHLRTTPGKNYQFFQYKILPDERPADYVDKLPEYNDYPGMSALFAPDPPFKVEPKEVKLPEPEKAGWVKFRTKFQALIPPGFRIREIDNPEIPNSIERRFRNYDE